MSKKKAIKANLEYIPGGIMGVSDSENVLVAELNPLCHNYEFVIWLKEIENPVTTQMELEQAKGDIKHLERQIEELQRNIDNYKEIETAAKSKGS